MQEVNLTKHSYMAKQLRSKVIDALERSNSGLKHDIILEKINVVLVGCFLKSINYTFWSFCQVFVPPSAKGISHHLPMVHRLFACDSGMNFGPGGCSRIVGKNPQVWTKQKHQTLSNGTRVTWEQQQEQEKGLVDENLSLLYLHHPTPCTWATKQTSCTGPHPINRTSWST